MDALNILAHQAQKFGVVTVIDAILFDRASGEAILELDTLKMANITAEAEEKEIRGGQAATQLIIYNYAKTATMEMQDALASLSSLEYLFGADVIKDDATVKHIKANLAVDSQGVIAFPAGVNDPDLIWPQTITVTDGVAREVLDMPSATIPDVTVAGLKGKTVTVYYQVEGTLGSQSITLASDSFTANVKLVGKTFVIDQRTGQRKAAELIIHNFKLDPTFELMFDSEGEASVFDFSGQALEDPDTKAMITLTYLNETEGFSISGE